MQIGLLPLHGVFKRISSKCVSHVQCHTHAHTQSHTITHTHTHNHTHNHTYAHKHIHRRRTHHTLWATPQVACSSLLHPQMPHLARQPATGHHQRRQNHQAVELGNFHARPHTCRACQVSLFGAIELWKALSQCLAQEWWTASLCSTLPVIITFSRFWIFLLPWSSTGGIPIG